MAEDLSFARAKRRSVLRSVAHRAQSPLRKVFGLDLVLRSLLNVERVTWRLAYENAGVKFGEDFHNAALAVELEWLPAGSTVLDIGCGTGRVARLLANRAGHITGIDYDAKSIETAQQRCPPNVRFEVGDARELPDDSYDAVLLTHVLEHLDDPVAVLSDVARHAPVLIVEVPAFNRDALNWARLRLGLDFSSDDDHVREYTPELLAEQLDAAGWKVEAMACSSLAVAAVAHRA